MTKFFQSAAFLAISGIIAKAVGALFKVPLTNVLGAEGMGIYQLVFPVYTVLLALSSGGLPQAISRMVSRCVAANDGRSAHRVLVVCMFALTIIGGIGSVLLLFSGGIISHLQGNPAAMPAYWALSPSVLFVSVMAVLRGYFQGHKNMFPTAVSQLTEQVVKLFAGLFIAYLMLSAGLVSGVAGALIGVSISEAAALAITALLYLIKRKKNSGLIQNPDAVTITNRAILKEIYKTAIPISLSALIMPMSQLIDSALVVNILKAMGQTTSEATTLYGIVTAPISTLVNLPTVLAAALAVAVIPNLATGDKQKTIGRYMRLASLAGTLGSSLLFVLGDELLLLLYGGLEPEQLLIASSLLKIMSISVLFVSLMQVMAAVMQAMGRAKLPAVNLLIGAAVKAVLTAALVFAVGISGSVYATVACYGVTLILDIFAMKRVTGSYYITQMLYPCVCALAAGGAAFGLKYLMSGCACWVILLAAGAAFAVVFTAVAVLTKSLKREDIIRV